MDHLGESNAGFVDRTLRRQTAPNPGKIGRLNLSNLRVKRDQINDCIARNSEEQIPRRIKFLRLFRLTIYAIRPEEHGKESDRAQRDSNQPEKNNP